MPTRRINNVKLGVFVLAGLLFLIVLLYMIGKNRNLFGSNYVLKARFENANGIVAGNNVRFSGIQAGTVKKITILSDTVIELTMLIDTRMKSVIRKNAIVSIATDGLVGNKVVNIVPSREPAALALEGDILFSKKSVNTDEMLQTLYNTNKDVAVISAGLKQTVEYINNSSALWTLLNDSTIPQNVKASISNIRQATIKAENLVSNLDEIVKDVKNGKGSAGAILTDTAIAQNLNEAILKIKKVGDEASELAVNINKVVSGIQQDVNNGKGTVNALLKDSMMTMQLNTSLDNLQRGTEGFNQSMEALKHNFLLRGYFRKLEKRKEKEAKKISKESKQ